ncbi:MAG: hypothetical protein RR393_07900 [Bacteroidales bacterium]
MRLAKEIEQYDTTGLTEEQVVHLDKLKHNLRVCACPSLYSQGDVSGKTNYVASIRCDDKCCFVCNFARQKMVRRRYMVWFADNKVVFIIKNSKGKEKFVTKSQLIKFPNYKIVQEVEYDLMHLTLSVPHYPGRGFNQNKYYYDDISTLFHRLRNKNEYFRSNVIGGEYGIETTNPENLHIHIHSLLLVKRKNKSRNCLHYELLRDWNRITENKDNQRLLIEAWQYPSIKAGNKMIDDNYIKELNPKGATIIGLECIYTLNAAGEKVRSSEWNSSDMIRAVMETISYHFAPQTFDKSEGRFDIDLFAQIKPVIYHKQLYRKFGVLHGETSLNIRSVSDGGELDIMNRVNTVDSVVDLETGELIEEPKTFVLTSPTHVYHDPDNNYKIILSCKARAEQYVLRAKTTGQAVAELRQKIKDSCN